MYHYVLVAATILQAYEKSNTANIHTDLPTLNWNIIIHMYELKAKNIVFCRLYFNAKHKIFLRTLKQHMHL